MSCREQHRFRPGFGIGFRSDDTGFRGVEVPDSTFDRTYATGSTVADTRLVATVGADDGTVTASVALDGPSSSDDDVDAVTDEFRGDAHAPDGTVSNITLRNATLQNVTLADSALVDVRVESAALENVTFENVTLRGVTLSGDSYSGTLSDEVITSEAELERELLVDEASGAASDGDLEADASADPDDGEAGTGGTVDETVDL